MVGLLLLSAGVVATVARGPVAVAAGNCASGATMNIVAHQDDDILFQSPNLLHEVQAGRCVRTVYVTAGDADGAGQATGRAARAGWRPRTRRWPVSPTAGQLPMPAFLVGPIRLRTLTSAPASITLAFLRLPDGEMRTVPAGPARTTKACRSSYQGAISSDPRGRRLGGVHQSLPHRARCLSLMNGFQPHAINTLDYVGSDGGR